MTTADCIPQVDAQASAQRTGTGGWIPVADCTGKLDPWLSSWFSLEITKDEFPWIFERRDRQSLVISTREALAILVSLELRFGDYSDTEDKRVLIVPSVTDNRGNGAALNKLMSTHFPSSAVLMELASFMKARNLRTFLEWAPREYNREADQLANDIMDAFDPEKRLRVSASTLTWNILPEALEAGREAERAFQDKKKNHGLPNRSMKQRKTKLETKLKVTDPW